MLILEALNALSLTPSETKHSVHVELVSFIIVLCSHRWVRPMPVHRATDTSNSKPVASISDHSTPVCGQIKVLTCIPTHSFDKKHDRSKHWGRSQLNPATLVGYLCY